MSNRRLILSAALVAVAVWLAGCATTPYQGEGKTKSDALLKHQFESAEKLSQTKPDGRLIFAGFAMHSQSKAFRGDVSTAEKTVLSIDPDAIVFKLSNPALGQGADWPYATLENIDQVLKKMGDLARPQDKVILLMSTHGNADVLSINFGNQYYPHVNAKSLSQSISSLRGKPTLVVLSACFSGSFLEPLRDVNRVVLTAAAKNRSSFGCQFQSTNTYFVDALLNQPSLQDRSIVQLMEAAKIDVDSRERKQKLSPSLPQMFVGASAKEWANQPVKSWLTAQ